MILLYIMEREELVEKYNIDIEKLKQEQMKLAKTLEIKSSLDMGAVNRVGAIVNIVVKNQIISAIAVLDINSYEVIEEAYFLDKLRFPYLHGFKAYRELPSMISAYKKLRERVDFVIIKGEGLNHSRLGLASHFSLAVGIPTIGVNDKLFEDNEVKNNAVYMNGKKVGCVLISKQGANPLYVCPGNGFGIEDACRLIEKMIVPPHKMPEPLHIVHKYAKDIKKELGM